MLPGQVRDLSIKLAELTTGYKASYIEPYVRRETQCAIDAAATHVLPRLHPCIAPTLNHSASSSFRVDLFSSLHLFSKRTCQVRRQM